MNENKIKEAKELFTTLKSTGQTRNIYNNVFNFLKNEIIELKEKGLTNNAIITILNQKLNEKIKLPTFNSWYRRNINNNKKKENK
jgi:hypothetical protein